MSKMDCPFCSDELRPTEGELAYSRPDGYPVTIGHTLVILTRHERNLLNATPGEWQAMCDLTRFEATRILGTPGVDGINIGINIGETAGQTVDHAHIHVIPRSIGDQPDPRGGVRRIIEQS